VHRFLVRAATRTAFVVALLFAAFVPIASAAPGDFSGVRMVVEMTGAAERPGPGDPDGSGTATFRFNPGLEQVCYELTVSGIAPATAAHIHVAPATEPGPIVIPLDAPAGGTSSECVAADRDLIRAIIKNPEAYYVNVHNAEYRAGAVRGQLG
jgi:hypothetical protein